RESNTPANCFCLSVFFHSTHVSTHVPSAWLPNHIVLFRRAHVGFVAENAIAVFPDFASMSSVVCHPRWDSQCPEWPRSCSVARMVQYELNKEGLCGPTLRRNCSLWTNTIGWLMRASSVRTIEWSSLKGRSSK